MLNVVFSQFHNSKVNNEAHIDDLNRDVFQRGQIVV